ncbi:MAG: hypothetical protein M1827_007079 [Pycnora praestabilis]|nr:MAG: hypothetical protein M1827_007079 [Pycnora praestabilis]
MWGGRTYGTEKGHLSLLELQRDRFSLHLARLTIPFTGVVINHRRKIKPTQVERLIFGDDAGLRGLAGRASPCRHLAHLPRRRYPPIDQAQFKSIADSNSDIASPAYAVETGTCFGPNGSLPVKPSKDFGGLIVTSIDLTETYLSKTLADSGGHNMLSDLIRLLVDTRRKETITHIDGNGGIASYSTIYISWNWVGLSKPLDRPHSDGFGGESFNGKGRTSASHVKGLANGKGGNGFGG